MTKSDGAYNIRNAAIRFTSLTAVFRKRDAVENQRRLRCFLRRRTINQMQDCRNLRFLATSGRPRVHSKPVSFAKFVRIADDDAIAAIRAAR